MPASDEGKRGNDVLSSLPATRPQRRSARRASAGSAETGPAGTNGQRETPSGGSAKAAPRSAARTRAKTPTRASTGTDKAGGDPVRPKAVRPSAATKRARQPGARAGSGGARPQKGTPPPEGLEFVTTAVQAAAELAQIGLSVGMRALRGAASRLPRP